MVCRLLSGMQNVSTTLNTASPPSPAPRSTATVTVAILVHGRKNNAELGARCWRGTYIQSASSQTSIEEFRVSSSRLLSVESSETSIEELRASPGRLLSVGDARHTLLDIR